MSDTQNPKLEDVTSTPVLAIPEVVETTETPSVPQENSSRDSRPQKGDRPRGNRRDGMREEEKEFKEEMLSIDRVTRVTAG
jgi:hypothetical protein